MSTATTYADIFTALMTRIQDNWTATAIHYPGNRYHPDPAAVFIQPRIPLLAGEQVSLGAHGHNRISGVFNIDIIGPLGNGALGFFQKIDLVRNLFLRGTTVPAGDGSIVFEVPETDMEMETEDTFEVRVRCPFFYDEAQ